MVNVIITCGHCEEYTSHGRFHAIEVINNWIAEYELTSFESENNSMFQMFTASFVNDVIDIDEFVDIVKIAPWKRTGLVSLFVQESESKRFIQKI